MAALKAAGVGICAISTDPREDSRALSQRLGLKDLPLLADPPMAVISAWGVAMSGGDLAVPATFVVDRQGTITWRYVGETQADRPKTADVVAHGLAALRR